MIIDNGALREGESPICNIITEAYNRYDFGAFTAHDVMYALDSENLTERDFAALLSPAALPFLEQMAQRGKHENAKHFGNSACLYTPLYIANYCVNQCVYCGFNCKNQITRAQLTLDEIKQEFEAIARTGLREILILTGESRVHSSLEYIGEAVSLAREYFSTIGIEIYPLDTDEYAYIHDCGADYVSVYQETYDTELYKKVHLSGPKRDYGYRLNSQERALLGGMRGVSVGALLGLGDFRKDAFAAGLHAKLLQQKYPHAEIAFSVPRIRPYKNNADSNSNDVHEPQLLQVMLAYRIFLPFAGISISTRERAGVGGHDEEKKGDEQFEIADKRSVAQIREQLSRNGLQPVFTDYIRV